MLWALVIRKNAVLKNYTKLRYNDKVIFIPGLQFFGLETKVCFYIFTSFFIRNYLTIFNKNIKLFIVDRMIGWINISTWIGSGNSRNVFIHISAVLEPDVMSGFFLFQTSICGKKVNKWKKQILR